MLGRPSSRPINELQQAFRLVLRECRKKMNSRKCDKFLAKFILGGNNQREYEMLLLYLVLIWLIILKQIKSVSIFQLDYCKNE
jgi:hypothetical protein